MTSGWLGVLGFVLVMVGTVTAVNRLTSYWERLPLLPLGALAVVAVLIAVMSAWLASVIVRGGR